MIKMPLDCQRKIWKPRGAQQVPSESRETKKKKIAPRQPSSPHNEHEKP
jgi:hypothetical protein